MNPKHLMRRARALIVCANLMAISACGEDAPELVLAQPDFVAFESTVYPVLLRDCSFFACHASSERFLQVYGPGRERLNPLTAYGEPPTMDELIYSYNRAISMIDGSDPAQSLLLRKPLSLAVGGSGHQGVDSWMRDIYVDREDPSFIALQDWVLSIAPAPQGTPP